jgi:hypothetical protein
VHELLHTTLELHIPIRFSNCFAGTQQGNSYGFGGGDFYGFGLWKMKFLNIPLIFSWVCFAGKMPANNIPYFILWVQEDERRARIVNPGEKKSMDAAGIAEPMTSR